MKHLVKRLGLPVAVGVLVAGGCSSNSVDPPSGNPDEGAVLAPSAIAQIEALLKEKEARTPAQRKIASALLYAQSGRFAQATAEQLDPAKRIVSLQKTDASGRVLVDIRAGMDQIAGKIEALGGKVVSAGADHARAWLPLGQLEPLAAEPAVRAIRPALTAATARTHQPGLDPRFNTTYEDRVAVVQAAVEAWNSSPHGDATPNAASQGSRVSQGDKAHATDRARRFYGVDGAGIKVGVLSDSDDF